MVLWTLEHLHLALGSPGWCITLAAFGILLRAAVFRPSLKSAANGERLQELYATPAAKALQQRMKESMARGDQADALAANSELRQLMRARGVGNPLRGLIVPALTIPVFFGAFKVLRAMADLPVPALREGGLAWWADLTVPDPYFALPIATGAVTVFMLRRMVSTMPPQQAGVVKLMMYVVGPLGVWFTISLPAALQFYFLVTGIGASAQALVMQSNTWRRRFGLPPRKITAPPGGSPVAGATGGATGAAAASGSTLAGSLNPIDNFKKAFDQARGGRDEKLRNNQTKDSLERARKHEDKRASEDREAYLRRREEALRRK
jgi:YidC/Oxa1 family membrane protein insertase